MRKPENDMQAVAPQPIPGRAAAKSGLSLAAFAVLAVVGGSVWGQVLEGRGPVVYCRDAVRGIVTRVLVQDCPAGAVISEAEAQKLRDASAERRRRLMFGDKPEAAPADPVQAEPAPPAPEPPKLSPPPRSAPEPAQPAAEPPRQQVAPAPAVEPPPRAVPAPAPAPVPAAPPPPLGAEFAEVKALVSGMKPGEFRSVGKNTMKDVTPQPNQTTWAVQGPLAIMSAWGGAAFDTKRNLLLVTGGGHNDYGGNEVYQFRLDTLRWERATEPSPMKALGNGQFEVADGTQAPISFHSYDGLVYVPTIDRMFALPQASYQSGNTYDNFAYFYDPGARTWTRGGKPAFRIGPDSGCDYWPKGNDVVCSTPNGIAGYSLAAKEWKIISANDNQDFGRTAVVDPVRNLFVQVWNKERHLAIFDLNSPSPRRMPAPLVGNVEFSAFANPGIAYHAPTGRYVIWPGGPEVWAIEPSAVRWQATKYRSGTGPERRQSFIGVYGKWQYVPALDVFVGVRWWDEPVYLYKLPKPGEVAGDTRDTSAIFPPSKVVAALRDGQTVDLPKGRFRDAIVVTASNVTIRGYGTVLFEASAESKAAIINKGRDNRFEGITVENARGSGNTGCIFHEGTNITLYRVTFRGCEMNVRTANGDERGFFHFDQSVSEDSVGSSQLGHNFYINQIPELRITGSRLIGCGADGHVLKSRAKKNIVENSVLAQLDRHCSRIVDFSQGGENLIRGSVLEHGTYEDVNADLIGDAREAGMFQPPLPEWPGELLLENNLIVSDWHGQSPGPGGAHIAIVTLGGKKLARFRQNTFVMPGANYRYDYRWPDAPAARFIDAGGNKWVVGRQAAGLPDYPAIPTPK